MYGRGHGRGTKRIRHQDSAWYAEIEAETLAVLEQSAADAPATELPACELCPERPGKPFVMRVESQRQGTRTRVHFFCGSCAADTRHMCTGTTSETLQSWDVGYPVRVVETPEGLHTFIQDGPRSSGKRLRFRVLKRDGYRCQLCGATAPDGVRLVVDHKIAVAHGGLTTYENLWTLCEPCNQGKGALSL